MKRQNSPQFRLSKNSIHDEASLRIEPFSKTFKKKYQLYEITSLNSTTNLIKTFSKSNLKPQKISPYQKTTTNRKIERKSTSKNKVQNYTEKMSLHSNGYQQTNLSISQKLVLINNIFGRKALSNQPKELISKFYQYNQQYRDTLYEWQKHEIYNEVDKLIYKLTQNYTRLMEDIITKSFLPLSTKLQQYQTYINQLIQQNKKLKAQLQHNKQIESLSSILYQNFASLYQKNQWSNLIIAQIAKKIDMDKFVQNNIIFTNITTKNGQNNTDSQLFTNSCILPAQNKELCTNQKSQSHQQFNNQQNKTLKRVQSAANMIKDSTLQ